MVRATARGQVVPAARHVELCDACQGHVAPGKSCYACGKKGADAPAPAPPCELHGGTGELGPCRACISVVEHEIPPEPRLTERTPVPPPAYPDDYRVGYLEGDRDAVSGLAPRPGDAPPLVATVGVTNREEFAAGYDAAICAHRLGLDVRKMIADDTLEPALESVPAIVDRLLTLRPELVAVPSPRKLLAERLLERFVNLPSEPVLAADWDLAITCFERAVNWYVWTYGAWHRPERDGFADFARLPVPYRVLSEANRQFVTTDEIETVNELFGTAIGVPVRACVGFIQELARMLGVEGRTEVIRTRVAALAARVHVEGEGHGT